MLQKTELILSESQKLVWKLIFTEALKFFGGLGAILTFNCNLIEE